MLFKVLTRAGLLSAAVDSTCLQTRLLSRSASSDFLLVFEFTLSTMHFLRGEILSCLLGCKYPAVQLNETEFALAGSWQQ